MYRTGGGPSNAPDFTDVEERVISICSNIKGLEARHDSDFIPCVPISAGNVVSMDVEDSGLLNAEKTNDTEALTPDISINIPDLDESFMLKQFNNNESQKENQWDKWRPKDLKTRVSNVLKPCVVNKASVTAKLDKLSSFRLELVQLQIETARREQQFKKEEHLLKMAHLAKDENRKQEVHELLLKKLNCASVANNMLYKDL